MCGTLIPCHWMAHKIEGSTIVARNGTATKKKTTPEQDEKALDKQDTKAMVPQSVKPMAVYDPATSSTRDAIMKSPLLPILHVFQDNGDEAEVYGEHPKGTIVDAATCDVVVEAGQARQFVCINRQPKYILTVWPKERQRAQPIFNCELDLDATPLSQVPREYLTPPNMETGDPGGRISSWDDEARGLCIRVNWAYAILMAPDFDEPYMAMFAWTSQRTGETIEKKETMRAINGHTTGALWALRTRERRNQKGVWYSPTVAIQGEPPDKAIESVRRYLTGQRKLPTELGWGEGSAD